MKKSKVGRFCVRRETPLLLTAALLALAFALAGCSALNRTALNLLDSAAAPLVAATLAAESTPTPVPTPEPSPSPLPAPTRTPELSAERQLALLAYLDDGRAAYASGLIICELEKDGVVKTLFAYYGADFKRDELVWFNMFDDEEILRIKGVYTEHVVLHDLPGAKTVRVSGKRFQGATFTQACDLNDLYKYYEAFKGLQAIQYPFACKYSDMLMVMCPETGDTQEILSIQQIADVYLDIVKPECQFTTESYTFEG